MVRRYKFVTPIFPVVCLDKGGDGEVAIAAAHRSAQIFWDSTFWCRRMQTWLGEIHILDIGLHPDYLSSITPEYQFIDNSIV